MQPTISTTTTTTIHRPRSVTMSIANVRRCGFGALTVLGCLVIGVNLYVFTVTTTTTTTSRTVVQRPMIHGLLLHPPRGNHNNNNNNNNNPVLSKQGSTAALQQGSNNRQQQWKDPLVATNNHHKDDDDKERVVQLLSQATITVTNDMRQRLPTWTQVTKVVGEHPVLHSLWTSTTSTSTCEAFQASVPGLRRMLGAAGMFSTGTNLVTTLLKNNCQIPQRVAYYGTNATREDHGMRWQVPWGKHTPAHYKNAHAAKMAKNINKDDILPVITIRNPYQWMKSMCKNSYSARWDHNHNGKCPNLQNHDNNHEWNRVTVKYGAGSESYTSLAHLFNDWYHGYTHNASYPWVMIRMEDLVFYTKETITQVCECAGGKIRTDRPFVYTVDSAKADSPGHDTTVGFVEAWIRYSQPPPVRGGFSVQDYEVAKSVLDPELMRIFGYVHPPEN